MKYFVKYSVFLGASWYVDQYECERNPSFIRPQTCTSALLSKHILCDMNALRSISEQRCAAVVNDRRFSFLRVLTR